jgi:hypothetical protein
LIVDGEHHAAALGRYLASELRTRLGVDDTATARFHERLCADGDPRLEMHLFGFTHEHYNL